MASQTEGKTSTCNGKQRTIHGHAEKCRHDCIFVNYTDFCIFDQTEAFLQITSTSSPIYHVRFDCSIELSVEKYVHHFSPIVFEFCNIFHSAYCPHKKNFSFRYELLLSTAH